MNAAAFTVAIHYVRLLTDHCSLNGLAPQRLLAEVGLPDTVLDDLDARLPFADFTKMMICAADWLQDPNLGLHLGQAFRPGYLGVQGIALLACPTVRDLVPRMVRYAALIHNACSDEVEERDGQWILHWRSNLPGNADPGRHHVELNFASIAVTARWLTGVQQAPSWVSFRHCPPATTHEHEALFACPLRFGAEQNAIAYPIGFLDLALLQSNPPVLRMMDMLSEQMLQKLHESAEPGWLRQCKQVIVDSLREGTPELRRIAAALGLTPRDLRRQLADCEHNFRDLVDELRRELATHYVEDAALPLADVASLLGFSEQSAFQRAFRRWTGEAPGRRRRALGRSNST